MSSNLCQSKCAVRIGTSEVPRTQVDLGIFQGDQLRYYDILSNQIALPSSYDNPINTAIRNHNLKDFKQAVTDVNEFFKDKEVKEEDFPLLSQRTNTNFSFTDVEIASFINDMQYTPVDLSKQSKIGNDKLLDQFEAFYTKDFSSSGMGSFCGLLPNIFGAVGSFFDTIDSVLNLKLPSLDFNLTLMLTALKSKLKSVIDGVVNKIKSQIENIKVNFENITSNLQSQISAKFQDIKTTAETFFGPDSINKLKSGIDGLIDYATGLFKNPSLEDIQYLLFRFCGFITKIENSLNAVAAPLNAFKDNTAEAVKATIIGSAINSRRAVSNGAKRLTANERKEAKNKAKSVRPTTTRRDDNTTAGSQVYDGKPLGEHGSFTPEELENHIKWNDGKGVPGKVTFTSRWPGILGDREGWAPVDIRLKTMIALIAEVFGKEVQILSANRPRWYNEQLRSRTKGVAKASLHLDGLALDCTWSGFDDSSMEDFIVIARYFGAKGIGRYRGSSFVHIDLGATRSWGSTPIDYGGDAGKEKIAEWVGIAAEKDEVEDTETEITQEDIDNYIEDREIINDARDGKYADGEIVELSDGPYRVELVAEENDDFYAAYDLVPL